MTDWVRLWHDMPTDPKWRVIARKSRQPLACVIAVFNLMMISASSNADDRGTMLGWDDEDAGAALDMDGEDVAAIREAMQGKVLDGERLSGWERRQPKREDNSTNRVKDFRERKRTQRNAEEHSETQVKRDVTQRNAPETETETETEKKKEGKSAQARARTADPFPCPEGVDPVDWDALKANRRTKRAALTEGAHRQITRKLTSWAEDGWPPGPIVAFAAERGWTSVFETDEMKVMANGLSRNPDAIAGLRGSRPDPALDMLIQAERELQAEAEREGQVFDFPARAALPPR